MLIERRWSERNRCRVSRAPRGRFTVHCSRRYTRLKTHGEEIMTMRSLVATWATLAAVSAVMLSGVANAAEIKVIGSPGTREPYTLLVPGFEKATGHTVTTT